MSVKKNFFYNSTLTLSQYIIGLITFPYISRVLGVSKVGVIGFVDNSSNYFVLFCTMGIGILGIREIAKFKDDKDALEKAFSSLLLLSILYTILILIAYIIAIIFVPQFAIYKDLFLIGAAKLVSTAFLVEWFFRGTENFKYISIRNIVIKILYVASLFILVKSREDYAIYFILTTSLVVVNAIINISYSRKYVKFSLKNIDIKKYLVPSASLGIYLVLTSTYTTFNVMYLGFVSTTTEVGFYWAALKIYAIFLGIYTAFTNVMMPRMSSLLAKNEHQEFRQMITKSFNILLSMSLPIIIISMMLSSELIFVLSGKEYGKSVILMQIIMPLILTVGVAQILAIQVLMPLGKDKIILQASILGAVIGLILNLLLVRRFGSIGTAFVLLLSEASVTAFYIIKTSKLNVINIPWRSFSTNLVGAIPYVIISYLVREIIHNPILTLLCTGSLSCLYMLFLQIYILKNDFFVKYFNSIKVYLGFKHFNLPA